MPRRPVFTDVMDALEQRIAAGEFMLRDIPGERTLAEEVGVSYMTARKAVLRLIEKQVLSRGVNGTLRVHPRMARTQGRCQVAMLTPAYPSTHLMLCRLLLSRATEARPIRFRAVEYVHWWDSIVKQAMDGSDGLFVIPSTEPMPERLLRAFCAPGMKVVFFDADMTEHGLPSIRLYASEHIGVLLDHLRGLGHRRVDMLNAQGRNDEIERRIGQWRAWCVSRGVRGELWDDPAPPYEDATARAHAAMHRLLASGGERPTAIVCTTQPAALGAVRACRDAGVEVGEELSVCTINNEPTGRYFCPSLTGLEMPDLGPLLERCFAWFASGPGVAWEGELRMVPERPRLFVGESTGSPRG